jgi:hypothetical protein
MSIFAKSDNAPREACRLAIGRWNPPISFPLKLRYNPVAQSGEAVLFPPEASARGAAAPERINSRPELQAT